MKAFTLVLVLCAAAVVHAGVVLDEPSSLSSAPQGAIPADFVPPQHSAHHANDRAGTFRGTVAPEHRIVLTAQEENGPSDEEIDAIFQDFVQKAAAASADGSAVQPAAFGADIKCHACVAAFDTLRYLERFKGMRWVTVKLSQLVCRWFNIMDENICTKVILEFKSLFMFMLRNPESDAKAACGVMKQGCPPPAYPRWDVEFDKPKPAVNPYPTGGADTYLMLHLTDLHVDYDYTEGFEADCGEPICCRPPFNIDNPKRAAQRWGDYNCDAPKRLYLDMMDHLAANFADKIKFAVLTGDLPPHDIWQETREQSVAIEQWLADHFHDKLPSIKMFPAVGNHESVPVNEFVPRSVTDPAFEMSWLYNTLADKWAYWIPEDAVATARKAGYYTVVAPTGVRVVSLNTNAGCNDQNWWLLLPSEESKDPDNMLHWFADVMKAAEEANESVYLIYHISPGNGCTGAWFENFHKILYRYENNIMGTFAGHTHDDVYDVTYAMEDGKQRAHYSTHYAGSMSPNGNENPTFRIYEVDAKTHAILDYTQYYANLTLANEQNKVTWEVLYKARDAYGLPDYSPESWHQASLKMKADPALNMFYHDMTSRNVDAVRGACDAACLVSARCSTYNAPPGFTTADLCDK